MPMTKFLKNDKGLTLIETMLSITILGIVMLGVMTLFKQAYLYTVLNEDKTIGINVARNALMYMEKQNFIEIKEKFASLGNNGQLQLLVCEHNGSARYTLIDSNTSPLSGCSDIQINDRKYNVTIETEPPKNNNSDYANYFIPLVVKVTWKHGNIEQSTQLKGVLTSEDIR
ncbi:prepilin-type N-terminal cleavage/methylation domain-containing protein [Anoxybacillus vitaminiphilus]|uniref:Prepilin-type N-terminal cleavage/methylation domain-containing protein n=1 Tax=Paranoxybacillus vitaminiphilus TaxID=581036 RepID=A0A327YK47_9BACL|nr:prepilin-type N-terminal cleavage/methylation domain-containing protein [Anoxybacillus vitaminiphilus]RAK21374.1 prepilin-type N-terminal cleavage/methylation domain-containing protein [Anoxybacillus vitaminiphilus]